MHKLNSLALVFGIFVTVASQGSQVVDRVVGPRSRHESVGGVIAELEFSGAKRQFVRVQHFSDFVAQARVFGYKPNVQLYSLKRGLVNKCAIPNGDIYLRFKPSVSQGERQLLLLAHGLTLVAEYCVEEHRYYHARCGSCVDPVRLVAKMQVEGAGQLALAEPDFDGVMKF